MKTNCLTYKAVEFIPERLENGIIYVSAPYKIAAHNCCCGCGEQVITPINPTDWSISIKNNQVTLYPSIGNWSYSCRSHYWIRNGRIIWSAQMSEEQIKQGRNIDRQIKERYFNEINKNKNWWWQITKKIRELIGL